MQDPSRHESESYLLAESLRASLGARAESLRQGLITAGCDHAVRPFLAMIAERGHAGINMSIPDCIRMIRQGAWLTIYEAISQETNCTGSELEHVVKARLMTRGADWYERRKKIEQTLKFTHDTHYAALNVGGVGAQRYGDCCVLIDWSQWRAVSTCFGGDTLRANFASDGTEAVDPQAIMESFAIGYDLDKVALITYAHSLRTYAIPTAGPRLRPPAFDEQEMRTAIESSDYLVELHLHGPVTIDQISGVVIGKSREMELWNQYLAWEGSGRPLTHTFEAARYFVELADLLEEHHIALKTAGGS